MRFLNLSNKIIEYSFYGLFIFVPLVFWKDTSELYELNKMWLTFLLVALIAAAWGIKTVVLKKFYIQRTPLDIPIVIFLASQVVSTIISWDSYVSFWGYYSRFNGGLLSTTCYIFLYYAFVSNFELKTKALEVVKRILLVSLGSGTLVVLWGLPSHFGYDPTCLLFRGSLDVSCWTAEFQPKLRIFSTLGQPDWLGAYLAILIPLLFAFFLNSKRRLLTLCYLLLATLFYLALLFTKSRSALLGVFVGLAIFALHYYFNELKLGVKNIQLKKIWTKTKPIFLTLVLFLIAAVYIYVPINISKGKIQPQKASEASGTFSSGGGGTESGKIRLFVWQGAVNAWVHNPIIGTGVETFAFAFYKYKPIGHNLTSEWNFLYNKAHNEFLNYLATSGILGLGSYLFIIGAFFYSLKRFLSKKINLLTLGIISGYVSILVTNFFGFSVVIVNLYLFLIPAFVFVLLKVLKPKKVFLFSFGKASETLEISLIQKAYIVFIAFICLYLILFLRNFWLADQAFALGGNLVKTGDLANSYYSLRETILRVPFEPTYKDELASDDAVFSASLLQNLPKDKKQETQAITFAENLAKEAIALAEQNTRDHPNNVSFWKTKFKVYYILSEIDPKYSKNAIDALEKAKILAPSDATNYYYLASIYMQNNDLKAIDALEKAIKLKPNLAASYNPYYFLSAFYFKLATNKDTIISTDYEKKAIDELKILLKIDPKNKDAQDFLELILKIDPNNKEAQDALDTFQK